MRKIEKKLLSFFMVLALVVALIPALSFKISAAPTIGDDGSTGKKVTFTYENAEATNVYVAGNFNNFAADSSDWKMEKNSEGIWELTKEIPSGVYGYKFVVDGEWTKDPKNYTYYPKSDNRKLVVPGAVKSPVVNGDTVTFNFPVEQVRAVSDADQGDVTKVCIKGGFNSWSDAEMSLSQDGTHYTYTATGLAADTYEYGINVYTTTGASGGTFCKDYYNMEAVSDRGNSIFTIASTEVYPDEDPNVKSPVVDGHNVTFNLYAPGAQSVYLAGSMMGTTNWGDGKVLMEYNEATGYWSKTLQNVDSGTYEYKFVKNGNWITDPLNKKVQNTNSAFTIAADVVSPVVDGNKVTFNFKPSANTYDSVVVAGTATTWDLTAAPAMVKDSATGIYSYTIEDMVPGTYEYKFVCNPASENKVWMKDPACTTTKNDNSAFTIAGLKQATGLTVKKGETLTLPSTLKLYKADGTESDASVTYKIDGESTASIANGVLSVPAGMSGNSLTLTASAASGETAKITVKLVDKVYKLTINFYYSRNTEPSIDDSDIYIFDVDGNTNTVLEFTKTITDDDGNVWLTGNVTIPYNNIGAIARITKGSWDGGKDSDRKFKLVDEDTTLWYEFGKDLTTTRPTIEKDEDKFDGIKVHFLSKDSEANIYLWNITPAAALEAPKWPGLKMTSEGDGWFGYELVGVDAASIVFNGASGKTTDLTRTTGEWWYAANKWYDHKPTAEEIEADSKDDSTNKDDSTLKILDGADGKYDKTGTYAIRIDEAMDKLVEVLVDDKVVDKANYIVTSGSTIITFTEAYLATLSDGKHNVTIKFTTGLAKTTLEISTKTAGDVDGGDSIPTGLIVSMVMCAAVAILVVKKRKSIA